MLSILAILTIFFGAGVIAFYFSTPPISRVSAIARLPQIKVATDFVAVCGQERLPYYSTPFFNNRYEEYEYFTTHTHPDLYLREFQVTFSKNLSEGIFGYREWQRNGSELTSEQEESFVFFRELTGEDQETIAAGMIVDGHWK